MLRARAVAQAVHSAYTESMKVDVVLLPNMLPDLRRRECTVVVFDVLRATTTMAAALSAGVGEIHIFGSTALAREAGQTQSQWLLCGEDQCHRPDGFDLGNSPGSFDAATHGGRTVGMSTTNGTRAILAARSARQIFTGALVNADSVARSALVSGLDVLLLCAGTNGEIAGEDVIGCGAVVHFMRTQGDVEVASDTGRLAEDLFLMHRDDLPRALRTTRGGQNVIAADLAADIDFAARLNALDVVGEVHPGGDAPIVRKVIH